LIEIKIFICSLAEDSYVHCIETFAALLCFEFYTVILLDLLFQTAYVYERLRIAVIVFDKAKAFVFIEELYSSG